MMKKALGGGDGELLPLPLGEYSGTVKLSPHLFRFLYPLKNLLFCGWLLIFLAITFFFQIRAKQ
jgi:hypothetical protein